MKQKKDFFGNNKQKPPDSRTRGNASEAFKVNNDNKVNKVF